MAILIDGLNLIYKFPELEELMYQSRLSDARTGLLNKLKEYKDISKTGIMVVFDGKKERSLDLKNEHVKGIDVYYSLEYSADFLIKQFVKKNINPKMITVVTSDKDIISYVRRFKAKTRTSEDFSRYINEAIENSSKSIEPEKDIDPEISEEEILYWEKQFKK
ncbi:MAG: NYN domain-containing protein [Spirochaetes bacterium]|nr:NYN domain-containing protein [Spirochaetota bacterium]